MHGLIFCDTHQGELSLIPMDLTGRLKLNSLH